MAAWNVVNKNNPFFISIEGSSPGEARKQGEKKA
jgi:hypothetical protein